MVKQVKKFTVTKVPVPRGKGTGYRYIGMLSAASGLGVTRQALSDYIRWGRPAISAAKRARIVIVEGVITPKQ